MKSAWKVVLINCFFSNKALVSNVFVIIGLIELILSIFLISARQVLILQGIFFSTFIGIFNNLIILPSGFYIYLPMPVNAKDIFKSFYLIFYFFTFVFGIISVILLIIANLYYPMHNFYFGLIMYILLLPVVLTVFSFLSSIVTIGRKYYVISQVLYWFLFSVLISLFSGWKGFRTFYFFKNIEIVFLNLMQKFNSSNQLIVIIFSAVYLICFIFSFISYKMSCYNFRKMTYIHDFTYYGNFYQNNYKV